MKKEKHNRLSTVLPKLPRYSYTKDGVQMEPVTLIISGRKNAIRKLFKKNEWFEADHLGPISLMRTITAAFLSTSYHQGLMNHSYINGRNFQLAFERPTKSDTYRRRHHLRLWKTNLKLKNSRIWVGTVSYDNSIGMTASAIPIHHISPTLAHEDEYLAKSLGIDDPKYIKIGVAEEGKINTGDPYIWNGKALLVELIGNS